MVLITIKRIVLFLILIPALVLAETSYIDDKVMVGLHQDKSTDSPIIKILSSGTALEVIKRENPMSQAREPGGASGWIDNKYLINTAPGRSQLLAAQEKITKLEADLTELKSGTQGPATTTGTDVAKITKENEELTQLLKSERLRIGELQAQTAELKNKLGKNTDDSKVLNQLNVISREKAELQKELSELKTRADNNGKNIDVNLGAFDWKKMLISITVSLILGFIAGLYVLDLINRRRHGGFRV